jgi:nicotinate-nucleotide pyrophosphorylase (carboxylating)
VASATHSIAEAIKPFGTRVTCTRKTMPGLRALQKYAVRVGGGSNHRFGLDDAVLIKDNHIALAGDVATAVGRARAGVGHMVKIELEVDTLAQLDVALQLGVDVVLLDNMGLDDLRTAVGMCKGRAITEASGRITPETAAVAATGVDQIAVGWLTHSARVLDIGWTLDGLPLSGCALPSMEGDGAIAAGRRCLLALAPVLWRWMNGKRLCPSHSSLGARSWFWLPQRWR